MRVVLDNKDIDVIIEHKQNKNLYIRVTDNLELLVTCNKRVSEKEILDIIEKNSKSLIKMYNKKLKELDNNSIFYLISKIFKCFFIIIKHFQFVVWHIVLDGDDFLENIVLFQDRHRHAHRHESFCLFIQI